MTVCQPANVWSDMVIQERRTPSPPLIPLSHRTLTTFEAATLRRADGRWGALAESCCGVAFGIDIDIDGVKHPLAQFEGLDRERNAGDEPCVDQRVRGQLAYTAHAGPTGEVSRAKGSGRGLPQAHQVTLRVLEVGERTHAGDRRPRCHRAASSGLDLL